MILYATEAGSASITLDLRGPLMATLEKHAARLGERPVDLLADILETVLGEDLVIAVLDR